MRTGTTSSTSLSRSLSLSLTLSLSCEEGIDLRDRWVSVIHHESIITHPASQPHPPTAGWRVDRGAAAAWHKQNSSVRMPTGERLETLRHGAQVAPWVSRSGFVAIYSCIRTNGTMVRRKIVLRTPYRVL